MKTSFSCACKKGSGSLSKEIVENSSFKFPELYIELIEQATFKLSKQMRQTRQYIRDQNIKVVKKSDLEFEIIVQGYHENVGYHSGKAKEKVQKVLKNVMSLD